MSLARFREFQGAVAALPARYLHLQSYVSGLLPQHVDRIVPPDTNETLAGHIAGLARLDKPYNLGPEDAFAPGLTLALVRAGANPNQRASRGSVPPFGAAYSLLGVVISNRWDPQRNAQVREMLELGADPNWTGPAPAESLATLLPHASGETLRALREAIQAQDRQGCVPALFAAQRFGYRPLPLFGPQRAQEDRELYELLLEYGADPTQTYNGKVIAR